MTRHHLFRKQRNSSEPEEAVSSFTDSFCIMEKHQFVSKGTFSLIVTISVRSKERSSKIRMKGYISAVATSVLQSSKIVIFCIGRGFIEHDNMQSTSDVPLVSMKQGVVLP